jgi:DNA polymerase III alpha subunit (gram-positive type)
MATADWISTLAAGLMPAENGAGEHLSASELLAGTEDLFVFDFEMSGPNPRVHELLDVGGVRARMAAGLPEVSAHGQRIRPRRIGNAEPGALRVVGYSARAWKDAVEFEVAFREFVARGSGAMLTGWGVGQDIAFLRESLALLSLDWPFAPLVLDVQSLARKLLAGPESPVTRFNLGHVADRLGIGRMGEHGALADAYATYDVLLKLLELAPAALDNS